MNGSVNTIAFGTTSAHGVIDGAITASVSASRGVLALQGTGLSFAGAFGTEAKVVRTGPSNRALSQDKSSGGWHPEAVEAAGAYGIGDEQGAALPEVAIHLGADMQATRLRTAHPATVIRNRHRCRSR